MHRRSDNDRNSLPSLDGGESVVGLSRRKTSIWIGGDPKQKDTTIGRLMRLHQRNSLTSAGIILVDPTVKEGFPLWYGYSNWAA